MEEKEKGVATITVVINVNDSDLVRAKNNAAELREILKSISNSVSDDFTESSHQNQ